MFLEYYNGHTTGGIYGGKHSSVWSCRGPRHLVDASADATARPKYRLPTESAERTSESVRELLSKRTHDPNALLAKGGNRIIIFVPLRREFGVEKRLRGISRLTDYDVHKTVLNVFGNHNSPNRVTDGAG